MTREQFDKLPRKTRKHAATLARRAKRKDQRKDFKLMEQIKREAAPPPEIAALLGDEN
jgi:hypothetical protein